MSGGGGGPQLYEVSVSDWARDRLLELAEVASRRGDGDAYLTALREFYRLLKLYPQFGDPLTDLSQDEGQVRLGTVPPLAMRYGVLEARRLVVVAARPVLLPRPRRGA